MGTRLTKIRMDELSGVDDPANDVPGWLVQKSKDWKDDVASFEKAVVDAHDSLSSEAVNLYFADAPDDVKSSLESVRKYIGDGLEEEKEEESTDSDPVTKGVLDRLGDLFKGAASETEAGTETETETEETSTEETSTEEEKESTEEEETTEKSTEVDAEAIAKSVGDAVNSEMEPMREALVKLADRLENVEESTAKRSGLTGQEGGTPNSEGEGKAEEEGISKAIRSALVNRRVELT